MKTLIGFGQLIFLTPTDQPDEFLFVPLHPKNPTSLALVLEQLRTNLVALCLSYPRGKRDKDKKLWDEEWKLQVTFQS